MSRLAQSGSPTVSRAELHTLAERNATGKISKHAELKDRLSVYTFVSNETTFDTSLESSSAIFLTSPQPVQCLPAASDCEKFVGINLRAISAFTI